MKKIVTILFCLFFYSGSMAQKSLIDDFISQGIKLHDKGDYTDAIDRYKKALVLDQRSPRANYEIAASYLAIRNYSKTIKHCDLVINGNIDYIDQAYILKGSAQDLMGKPLDAVKTYKKGIQKYSTNHLLHYNLALTLFKLKNYGDTEESLIRALKIDPSHASSHFLLALNMLFQEQRVKGILALYNYLLLEPKNKRTASAIQTLEEEMQKLIAKDSANAPLLPEQKSEVEFQLAAQMLRKSVAEQKDSTNKIPNEIMAAHTNLLFSILGELKENKKGFWWNFYVDYFSTLSKESHTEAFCYYIFQSKDDAYTEWLKENRSKIEAFSAWYVGYLHKY